MAEHTPFEPIKASAKQLKLLEARESKRGLFIVFEGPDGAGKSTQKKLFKKWLESEGHEVVSTKSNTSLLIKPLIRARKLAHTLSPAEACLLEAAEFRHRLENQILPALWKGQIVLADRHLFTNLARNAARGLRLDWQLNAYAPLFWPDMVFYFAISAEASIDRIAATGEPTYYQAGQDITDIDNPFASYRQFMKRVLQEYESLALIFHFMTVDAEQSIYTQHRNLRQLFRQGTKRPWTEWNADAVLEWLAHKPPAGEVESE
jgi:dTMP kinase